MSEELKPCPFCGGTNLSIDTNSVQPDNFHDAHVDCDDCSAQGRHAMTLEGWLSSKEEAREEAIAAWNRRATPPSPSTAEEHKGDSRTANMPSTANEAGELPPLPKAWQERMADYYAKGGSQQAHGARVFNELEIEEWREWGEKARAALAAKTATREEKPSKALLLMDDVDDLIRWASCHAPVELYNKSSSAFWKVCHMIAGTSKPAPACAANPVQPSTGEVDVEAERKLFEACMKPGYLSRCTEPGYTDQYADSHTQMAWKAWLAARRTQADAGRDAARYRWLVKQIPCNIADALDCAIPDTAIVIDAAIAATQSTEQPK